MTQKKLRDEARKVLSDMLKSSVTEQAAQVAIQILNLPDRKSE